MQKKRWQIDVHLHREYYGNSENWQKTWQIAVIHQTRLCFSITNVFLLYGISPTVHYLS